jgi:plasmid maintenance system antidote protein VapI
MKRRQYDSLTEALKDAIEESGTYLLTLEQETGVQRASISRFLRGSQTLRLDIAERLMKHFGLVVTKKGK